MPKSTRQSHQFEYGAGINLPRPRGPLHFRPDRQLPPLQFPSRQPANLVNPYSTIDNSEPSYSVIQNSVPPYLTRPRLRDFGSPTGWSTTPRLEIGWPSTDTVIPIIGFPGPPFGNASAASPIPEPDITGAGSRRPRSSRKSPQERTVNLTGQYIRFESGQFEGRTMRAELVEIQKANVGRKFGGVDRRAIDPPPTVQYKLFELHPDGIEREITDYGDVFTHSLICSVDLFHAPSEDSSDPGITVGPPVTDPINPLMGATSISPNLIELHGRKALVFAFGNLAVRAEGDFVLRYRVADILAGTGIDGVFPIQAICYGGPFHVFSTKDFPGYEASTELTKVRRSTFSRMNYQLDPVHPSSWVYRLSRSGALKSMFENTGGADAERRTQPPL
ncbi:velvet family sexual development regulator, variant 2 [Coprinopsis cinerea AmutBmut pab1-1]|nr:velvet family sexual development regulator, variant 2 [Coprinopsis cinerea AmutBmut pab1-1]